MTRLLFIVLCLCILGACTQSAEDQWETHRRAAAAMLDAQDEATRAAFQRLPPCPAADTAGLRYDALVDNPLRIPSTFQREASTYMHGGERFRKGDTLIELVNGHFGWASVTGKYGGGGVVPAGCVARLGGRIYIVSEARDSTRFYASAIVVSDTNEVYGDRRLGITAPHSVRGWLLGLLTLRPAAAQFQEPWIHVFRNHLVATAFDASRLAWRADTADVWVRREFDEPMRSPDDSTETFTAMDVNLLVHCPSRHARDVRMLVRDAAGDSIDGLTYASPSYVPFQEAPRQTVLENLCAVLPGVRRSR